MQRLNPIAPFGKGESLKSKTIEQIHGIVKRISQNHYNILATRAKLEVFEGIQKVIDDCQYNEICRIIVINPRLVERVAISS